ncbi:hypothetical protein K456DRAFT_34161 [Colletotrichum gloeosporioides 23]|nr:hypothetical protein K456DRAFT_34161 [Colletotrichum gloeosporioides 23]
MSTFVTLEIKEYVIVAVELNPGVVMGEVVVLASPLSSRVNTAAMQTSTSLSSPCLTSVNEGRGPPRPPKHPKYSNALTKGGDIVDSLVLVDTEGLTEDVVEPLEVGLGFGMTLDVGESEKLLNDPIEVVLGFVVSLIVVLTLLVDVDRVVEIRPDEEETLDEAVVLVAVLVLNSILPKVELLAVFPVLVDSTLVDEVLMDGMSVIVVETVTDVPLLEETSAADVMTMAVEDEVMGNNADRMVEELSGKFIDELDDVVIDELDDEPANELKVELDGEDKELADEELDDEEELDDVEVALVEIVLQLAMAEP